MKTKTIKIYDFDELSESAKETALDNMRTINNEYYEWWSFTYEDAETIGLCLTGFGLDRDRHATGNFKDSAESCAHLIIDNHGETCETYKTATVYLADRFNTIENAPVDENGELASEYNLDSDLDNLDNEFLRSILEDYSISLQREYEYICNAARKIYWKLLPAMDIHLMLTDNWRQCEIIPSKLARR